MAMKKPRLLHLVALLSTSLFLFLQMLDPVIVREIIESKTYDLRLHLRDRLHPPPPRDDILIVSVDEKSISDIGRWPWSREVIARLIDRISEGGPKAIAVDILFSERESREADGRLVASLRKAGNVVLATAFIVPKGVKEIPPPKNIPGSLMDAAFMEVSSVEGIPWRKFAIKAESALPPLDEFCDAAALGHVYSLPDLDGVLRWEELYVTFGDDCYPSLSLQTARVALGIPMKEMALYGGSKVRLGSTLLSTDLSGRALINYRGEERSFPYLPASDVLNGKIAPERFRGRIVLVGTSAIGTYDQKVTPLSANLPGVEKNATAIANILDNGFLKRSPGVVELVFILVTGALLGILLPRYMAMGSAVLGGGFILSYLLAINYMLVYKGWWLNVVYPFTNVVVIIAAHTVTSLFAEEKRAREIRKMFSSYVSPKIVEQLVDHPEWAKLGGERKEVTLLFSDIRGFTTFSEKREPEEVVLMLNEYFKEMTEVVFHWDGTLDKFIGDAILAFWGAPLDQPDHAERAVRCALHMSDRLDMLHAKWLAEGKEALDCGIGINTGPVVIGNIGAVGKKMDYTVIGDHVNIGSRVQGLTKTYKTRIILTEYTVAKIQTLIDEGRMGHLDLVSADTVTVKGKETPVKVFRLGSGRHEEEEAGPIKSG